MQKNLDANFTAGGLLYNDFVAISSILTSDNFLKEINEEIQVNKLLGIPTESARKRVILEIVRRYEIVSTTFWDWFVTISEMEQKLALFYVCLKTYPIVFDLHMEVGLKKYKLGADLDAFAVKMRLDELSSMNDSVGLWSESTLDKINSQYRTILKDCGLLMGEVLCPPSNIADSFWDYFEGIGEEWFKEMCFK
jgi:hypothetical protein